MATPQEILRAHQLRQTKSRVAVLEVFQRVGKALSHSDLEGELEGQDRVTLYRTLNTFIEENILHKVLDDHAVVKFALSSGEVDHAHFKCEKCGSTTCLEIEVPSIIVPDGYERHHQELLVIGICPNCSA